MLNKKGMTKNQPQRRARKHEPDETLLKPQFPESPGTDYDVSTLDDNSRA
jgi:hypothetical protein